VAWNPPEYVDIEEVEEAAREMGFLPEKSGQEYIDHLRDETDVQDSIPEARAGVTNVGRTIEKARATAANLSLNDLL